MCSCDDTLLGGNVRGIGTPGGKGRIKGTQRAGNTALAGHVKDLLQLVEVRRQLARIARLLVGALNRLLSKNVSRILHTAGFNAAKEIAARIKRARGDVETLGHITRRGGVGYVVLNDANGLLDNIEGL